VTSPAAQTPPAPRIRRGVDVSHYQGAIDWPAVAASGIEIVYVKLLEGLYSADANGVPNIERARRAGLRVGAYHYLTAADPEEQARAFLRHLPADVEGLPGLLPPALDLESPALGDEAGVRAAAWLEAVEEALGVAPIVYTGPAFARAHGLAKVPGLGRYGLWVAHYGVDRPAPVDPWGVAWLGHQYTGSGACPGIVGPVDLSRWRAIPGAAEES
jgi:lysozyme